MEFTYRTAEEFLDKYHAALENADPRPGQYDSAPEPPQQPPADPVTSPSRPSVAEAYDLLKEARACPHRKDAECRCTEWARCALGKGSGGKVSMVDCIGCIRAQRAAAPGEGPAGADT